MIGQRESRMGIAPATDHFEMRPERFRPEGIGALQFARPTLLRFVNHGEKLLQLIRQLVQQQTEERRMPDRDEP